jgi:nascent polypeptide-associated complex subunit alpha
MGVDFKQLDGVTEVIIRLSDRELVLDTPQVMQMNAQGENIFQIIGESEERGLTTTSDASEAAPPSETFTEEDVQLVANQANVSEDEAREALRAAEGNLAKAIITLTGG